MRKHLLEKRKEAYITLSDLEMYLDDFIPKSGYKRREYYITLQSTHTDLIKGISDDDTMLTFRDEEIRLMCYR